MMARDPILGAMMREMIRRQEQAELFDRTAITDGVTFHMALIPTLMPDNRGCLEVARMENGRVAEIIGKTGLHRLDQLTVEGAENWFQETRISWLDNRKKEE